MSEICEIENDCFGPVDRHHIKTRGAGGKDIEENIIFLCRKHHTEVHAIGRVTFFKKYGIESRLIKALEAHEVGA
jgi:hypothetical protein